MNNVHEALWTLETRHYRNANKSMDDTYSTPRHTSESIASPLRALIILPTLSTPRQRSRPFRAAGNVAFFYPDRLVPSGFYRALSGPSQTFILFLCNDGNGCARPSAFRSSVMADVLLVAATLLRNYATSRPNAIRCRIGPSRRWHVTGAIRDCAPWWRSNVFRAHRARPGSNPALAPLRIYRWWWWWWDGDDWCAAKRRHAPSRCSIYSALAHTARLVAVACVLMTLFKPGFIS